MRVGLTRQRNVDPEDPLAQPLRPVKCDLPGGSRQDQNKLLAAIPTSHILLSDRARHVTGSEVVVDGGSTAGTA